MIQMFLPLIFLVSYYNPAALVQWPPVQQEGTATYYGAGESGMHGKITATGEEFNPEDHTCASRTLPLNSIVLVENVKTGSWAYCRVNDRGPYGARLNEKAGGGWAAMFRRKGYYAVRRRSGGRWLKPERYERKPGRYLSIMDLSYGTAKALGVDLEAGRNPIRVRYWEGHLPVSPRLLDVYRTSLSTCTEGALACGL